MDIGNDPFIVDNAQLFIKVEGEENYKFISKFDYLHVEIKISETEENSQDEDVNASISWTARNGQIKTASVEAEMLSFPPPKNIDDAAILFDIVVEDLGSGTIQMTGVQINNLLRDADKSNDEFLVISEMKGVALGLICLSKEETTEVVEAESPNLTV